MTWNKIGKGYNGSIEYGVWQSVDETGKTIYRVQRAPIIPQGRAGYYNLEAHLRLCNVSMDSALV
jgi:hypothetical protein